MAAQFPQTNTRPPTNPFQMSSVCKQFTAIDGTAHIYLLRYQTPEDLMRTISNLYPQVYDDLNRVFFNYQSNALIGLGYFYLYYNGSGNMFVAIYDTDSIPVAVASMGTGKPTLTSQQFHRAGNIIPNFVTFFQALVYKAFLEGFIQSNRRLDVPFQTTISLDLYAERSSGQAHLFHKDATDAFPTKFFTLTYIMENPDIIVKGPTIVTGEQIPVRTPVTPAVRHGTTVGIDNTAVLHATPDTQVNIGTVHPHLSGFRLPPQRIPQQNPQFSLSRTREGLPYEGQELSTNQVIRLAQSSAIEQATGETKRAFIRTWYNHAGFPDPGDAPLLMLLQLTLDINSVFAWLRNITDNTCFIDSPNISPELILRNLDMQRMSLGGAVNASLKPMYEPLVNASLKPQYEEVVNASLKPKPSITDVVASPEFQKLLASTDNFILGTIVKGNDKGTTLSMGGKQISRSKKRTMKRSKRSKTHRKIIRPKQKTQIITKRTKTKR